MDSNPLGAIIGGIIGAVVGALIWTGVTIVLRQEFGIVAIGIGFLTGFFVRTLGKGTTSIYGAIYVYPFWMYSWQDIYCGFSSIPGDRSIIL